MCTAVPLFSANYLLVLLGIKPLPGSRLITVIIMVRTIPKFGDQNSGQGRRQSVSHGRKAIDKEIGVRVQVYEQI